MFLMVAYRKLEKNNNFEVTRDLLSFLLFPSEAQFLMVTKLPKMSNSLFVWTVILKTDKKTLLDNILFITNSLLYNFNKHNNHFT